MRALIIISASRATVIEPSRTCSTNSLTRFLPRSRAPASLNRPCSSIWSRRLPSASATCATATGPLAASFLAIGLPLLTYFGLQLVQLLGLADRIQQRFVQLIVRLQRAFQVIQAGS